MYQYILNLNHTNTYDNLSALGKFALIVLVAATASKHI